MARRTIFALLSHAREFHRSLQTIYAGLAQLAHKESVKGFLEQLSRHEQGLEQAVNNLEGDLEVELLHHWIADPPPDSRWHAIRKICFRPDMPLDEVVKLAIHADQLLVELYREVCALPLPDAVREVFRDLLASARQERDHLAYDVKPEAE